MGTTTFLYGVIQEFGLNNRETFYAHNETIIESLPNNDNWPPISKEMFSITKNTEYDEGPNLEYCGRSIHFAATLKSVEDDWNLWKDKFETLLEKLYWLHAHVHFKSEFLHTMSFEWEQDSIWNIGEKKPKLSQKKNWNFNNLNNWK